ncbi:spore germination protein (amino acid permease) [Tumebacillus sp. BK434]|nr:spore germination protein (amino acid permease) [Tumebacillus sp. BK434]
MVYMMSTGLLNHVTLIRVLVEKAGRDAWLGGLAALGFTLVWIFLLVFIVRRMRGVHLAQWLQKTTGRAVAYGLLAFMSALLFVNAVSTLFELLQWTKGIYMINTPLLVLGSSLLLICLYSAYHGIYSVRKTTSLLLPFVMLFGFFVAFANSGNKEAAMLTPILAQGLGPVGNAAFFEMAGFGELFWILLLQHRLQQIGSLTKGLSILSVILFGLTVGPLIGAIMEFGPNGTAELRFPPYEEWRLVKLGDYVEHTDFLSIYQWITGAYVRLSFHFYLILELFRLTEQKTKKVRGWLLISLGTGALLICVLPVSDPQYLHLLTAYVLPGMVFSFLGLSVMLGGVALFAKKEMPQRDEEEKHTKAV